MIVKRTIIAVAAVALVLGGQPRAEAPKSTPHVPTMAQFMSAGYPVEMVAATKADRVAWISNDKGLRNVFTASAPGFQPVRVTPFMKDDGVDTTQLSISDDGAIVSFTIEGAHPEDLAQLLDRRGVFVRHGHHCTMPLHDWLGAPATVRASFGLYNTSAEVDALVDAIHFALQKLRVEK